MKMISAGDIIRALIYHMHRQRIRPQNWSVAIEPIRAKLPHRRRSRCDCIDYRARLVMIFAGQSPRRVVMMLILHHFFDDYTSLFLISRGASPPFGTDISISPRLYDAIDLFHHFLGQEATPRPSPASPADDESPHFSARQIVAPVVSRAHHAIFRAR